MSLLRNVEGLVDDFEMRPASRTAWGQEQEKTLRVEADASVGQQQKRQRNRPQKKI
jgi:hypothetical protein